MKYDNRKSDIEHFRELNDAICKDWMEVIHHIFMAKLLTLLKTGKTFFLLTMNMNYWMKKKPKII